MTALVPVRLLLTLAAATVLLGGCANRDRKPPPEPEPDPKPRVDPLRRGTVGELALIGDVSPRVVRGFGLVVGLEGTGSRDCADSIRNYLIDRLQKLDPRRRADFDEATDSINALINSPNTAVVELTAFIPPGAPEGSPFDVLVGAATATQTSSLEGGLLLPAELKIVGVALSGKGILAGRTIAEASGPLYTSPFVGEARGSVLADPRRALVLGGGIVQQENAIRLVLAEPSTTIARRIGQRINERFGPEPPTAEAMSQSYLYLHTPMSYVGSSLAFAQLAAHVFMRNDPAFFDAKLRELNEYAVTPGADHAELSIAWVGIGRIALPRIQPFYESADPSLAFHATRAGLELDDDAAVPVMRAIAAQQDHPFRLHATHALGRSRLVRSDAALVSLLDDIDPEVRVAAYEGLVQRGHRSVQSLVFRHRLDKDYVNLTLDIVDSDGPPLIYARRTGRPRIAVFGANTPLVPPLFYRQETRRLTITASDTDDQVRVMGKILADGPLERFTIEPLATHLISALAARPDPDMQGAPLGLGMCYSRVVHVLSQMSEKGSLPAPVMFERAALRELFGPVEGGRREADDEVWPENEPGDDDAPPGRQESAEDIEQSELRRQNPEDFAGEYADELPQEE